MRNARKAILLACLTPDAIAEAEYKGDMTVRLGLQEESKTLPFGAIWDYYCMKQGVPVGNQWIDKTKKYERDVLVLR